MSKINVPIHKIKLSELFKSSPDGNIDKLYIQCELSAIKDGDADFSIIIYAADRENKKWSIGKRVQGFAFEKKSFQLDRPIGFANTEVSFRLGKKKYKFDHDHKLTHGNKPKTHPLAELWRSMDTDKKIFDAAELIITPKISDNPHLTFDVSIDSGERQIQLTANPSPPAPPLEDDLLL